MIDKRMLVDIVTIQKVKSKDKWGKPEYDDPITLKDVKFDQSIELTGTANHRSESKPSVLLVYPKFCPIVIDSSFQEGIVGYDGREFIIRKIIPQKHPFKNEVLCYEVEVV